MLGYTPPASQTARQWLDRFHDEGLTTGRSRQGSSIPPESKPLAGLREVNRQVIGAYIETLHPGGEITLDVDAQLIETNKAEAKYCYEGYKAYQPIQVCWAETMSRLVGTV